MHRSGTSATTSALGELGLKLPKEADLLGARFGNDRGHFESKSLMAFSDELLAALGRSWDDPPRLGEVTLELLERHADRARSTFEAAFESPGTAVLWKDPRTALLLPFWRHVLDRPIVAVLVTRDPLEVARSLDRRNAIGISTGLALWERYFRHAIAGLAGLPVYVSAFKDALSRTEEWKQEMADWLEGMGVRSGARALPFEQGMRHERRQGAEDDSIVLPSQRLIYARLLEVRGQHESFEPPQLGEEPAWVTDHLQHRHDLMRVWRGFEWLGGELARLPPPRPPLTPVTSASSYPKDATEDEQAYHSWLRQRGEAVNVGSGPGIARAAIRAGTGHEPRFSIVVPAYRSPIWAIDRCVSSVLCQDYGDYELLIVDDASGDRDLVEHLAEIEQVDPRVQVHLRGNNGGISAATNDALGRARGEWVVFLDHDDELAAGALTKLARVADAVANAGLLYSDEDKIDESGRRFMPAFKPGWSPDLLLSNAYMCHILVVRRSLLEELGGLRSEFDGAQDYDLMLRATERLADDQIVHIPEILYHWRTMAGSASGDPAAKPWAFQAGRRALRDAVARRGFEAEVESHPKIPGSYYVKRRMSGQPFVSAVIPFRDEPALLAACYRSFVNDPGHEDFELLLVDNDSVL
ncbi:MAG: glycosyltransferase, partial [Acidimicrobiales bacterium]